MATKTIAEGVTYEEAVRMAEAISLLNEECGHWNVFPRVVHHVRKGTADVVLDAFDESTLPSVVEAIMNA